MVKRGRPRSLLLRRLNPQVTATRAPGPGPIRSDEWRPNREDKVENISAYPQLEGLFSSFKDPIMAAIAR